jgi:hypothetical protein
MEFVLLWSYSQDVATGSSHETDIYNPQYYTLFKTYFNDIFPSTTSSFTWYLMFDRLCGLVISVADYKHRGSGFDSRALLKILKKEFGLERGPLSLVIG